jgi:hypothetical protein
MYLLSKMVFDQRRRFSHEGDAWLMPRVNGSLRQKKWESSIRWVISSMSANVQYAGHSFLLVCSTDSNPIP